MTAIFAAVGIALILGSIALPILIGRARRPAPEPEPAGPLFDFGDIVWDWPSYPQNLDFRDSGDLLHAHLLAASRAAFTPDGHRTP